MYFTLTEGGGHNSYLTKYPTKMSREPLLDTGMVAQRRQEATQVMGLECTMSCLGTMRLPKPFFVRFREYGANC